MTLQKNVLDRLRAGATVILVEEPDEILATAACVMAAKAIPVGDGKRTAKVEVLSILDPEFDDKLAAHKSKGDGVIIVCDFLRVYGTNAGAIRRLREFALQTESDRMPRLILIESPGVEIPAALKGDIEYIMPPLPSVEELKQELDLFVKSQGIKLEGNGENRHAIAQALAGLARHEAARLLARCYVDLKTLDPAWLRSAKAERVTERLGGALSFVDTDAPDVGGQENLVNWLKTRGKAFASEKAKKYGLPEIKGLLVTGIPGTGKSLFVRYTAREIKLPLLRFDVGKVFGSLVGQSEAQVRQAIEAAEACAPCVLWIDEIEKGMGGTKGASGDSGTTQRVFGTILTWLQEKKKPVFVVATANRVADLPPELLRKGRFDEIFFVDLPNQEEREDIARIHVLRRDRFVTQEDKDKAIVVEAEQIKNSKEKEKPEPRLPGMAVLDPKEIANICDGFSGAEIEQAVVDGMFTAYAAEREVTLDDIVKAASATMPLSKTMAEDITKLRKWAQGRARYAGKGEKVEEAAKQANYDGVVRRKLDLSAEMKKPEEGK